MNTLITISGLGLAAMLAEIFNFKKLLPYLTFLGLLVGLFFCVQDWNLNQQYFNDMMRFDNYAIAFSGVIICIALLWFWMSDQFFKSESSISDHYSLILFTIAGAVVMASYANLTMFFIGLEILSISLYILAASNKRDAKSNEAGLKYFLMGSFATGFLLFGIALIYGVTGSFNLERIAAFVTTNHDSLPLIFNIGIILLLVGLLFKIAAVPFHFWAPDVYEGSPNAVTAFMATIVKTAAFAAFFRLFITCFATVTESWTDVIMIISALTMLTGNIIAVMQKSFKRMLAYSSIAHAGYMLMAVLSVSQTGSQALLLYAAAYSVASLSAFAFLNVVASQTNDGTIESFKGIGKAYPLLSALIAITMLSLAGIPPLAGFLAKYYMFLAAFQAGYMKLVLIAVIASLIGIYYYLRVVISIFQPSHSTVNLIITPRQMAFFITAAVLTFLLGVAPMLITGLL